MPRSRRAHAALTPRSRRASVTQRSRPAHAALTPRSRSRHVTPRSRRAHAALTPTMSVRTPPTPPAYRWLQGLGWVFMAVLAAVRRACLVARFSLKL